MFDHLDLPFKYLVVPVFFLVAAIFAYNFTIVLKVYKTKRNRTPLLLMVMFLGCVAIAICSALDGLFYKEVGGYSLRFGYATSLVFTAVAVIGLLYFSTEVFSSGTIQTPLRVVRIIFSIILIIIAAWGTISIMGGEVIPMALIYLFMLNLTLYILLAVRAYKLAKRVDEEVYKKSITYIGHFAICNLGIYFFFILDGILAEPDQSGMTVWSLLGACVFAIAAYLSYVGFVRPMRAK